METLRHLVVLIHLVGFALLFGAWAVEAVNGHRGITRLMNWGLAVAGLAGLILAAPWGIEYELNYVKLGVKLVILVDHRRAPRDRRGAPAQERLGAARDLLVDRRADAGQRGDRPALALTVRTRKLPKAGP